MRKLRSIFKLALNALIWRESDNPPVLHLPALLFVSVVALAFLLGVQFVRVGNEFIFNPGGVNAEIAVLATSMLLTALLVKSRRRITALVAMLVVSIFVTSLLVTVEVFSQAIFTHVDNDSWVASIFGVSWTAAILIWYAGTIAAILRSVEHVSWKWAATKAVGLCLMSWGLLWLLPYYPTFMSYDYDRRTANSWEFVRAALAGDRGFEKSDEWRPIENWGAIELSQPSLLERSLTAIAPQKPGKTDVFVIGIAGWGGQDVFLRELNGAIRSLSGVFSIEQRSIRLINNRDTVHDVPIANRQNFSTAVRSIAKVMDREEDVLIVFLTSHGSKRGVELQLGSNVYSGLTPDQVASTLKSAGIRNRVLVVSACYAGIFLESLADDNSIVITAADADSTSFGCADDRYWTYFGDAFFNLSMTPERNLQQTFEAAKSLIREWEAGEGLKPSNPQAHFGKACGKA